MKFHCNLCLPLHGEKFVSSDYKEYFYTLHTSRDTCHNCQNSRTSDVKV